MTKETEGFKVDEIGIPYGQCMDCVHCKFRYADDSWHCELEDQKDTCHFEFD